MFSIRPAPAGSKKGGYIKPTTTSPQPLDARLADMSGRTFGYLIVLHYVGSRYWLCKCECGKTRLARGTHLREGSATSCGCQWRPNNYAHGMTESPTYSTWCAMKKRCLNPNSARYSGYGARGITVCERWKNSFEAFLADMGLKPSLQHSIERIDNNIGYEPSNCRWALASEQSRNTRRTMMFDRDGRRMCVTDWATELGIERNLVYGRISRGWSISDALLRPVKHIVRREKNETHQ